MTRPLCQATHLTLRRAQPRFSEAPQTGSRETRPPVGSTSFWPPGWGPETGPAGTAQARPAPRCEHVGEARGAESPKNGGLASESRWTAVWHLPNSFSLPLTSIQFGKLGIHLPWARGRRGVSRSGVLTPEELVGLAGILTRRGVTRRGLRAAPRTRQPDGGATGNPKFGEGRVWGGFSPDGP